MIKLSAPPVAKYSPQLEKSIAVTPEV